MLIIWLWWRIFNWLILLKTDAVDYFLNLVLERLINLLLLLQLKTDFHDTLLVIRQDVMCVAGDNLILKNTT